MHGHIAIRNDMVLISQISKNYSQYYHYVGFCEYLALHIEQWRITARAIDKHRTFDWNTV